MLADNFRTSWGYDYDLPLYLRALIILLEISKLTIKPLTFVKKDVFYKVFMMSANTVLF